MAATMILECHVCGKQNRIPAERLEDGPKCGSCKAALSVDAPVHVSSEAEFDELIAGSPRPVLVDFWASWCGPCRMVAPEVAKLARQHAGRLVVAKVSTEDVPEVASRFGVHSIPTLALFSKGREVKRVSGAMPARSIEQQFGL